MNSMEQGPALSVAMIVRNAAEPLAETLESIRGLADEIVIVDTGSTDSTGEVAGQYDVRFYSIAWQDDFSAARNHAAQLCTGRWILWLDAGERLAPEAVEQLKQFIATGAQTDTAYMLVVRLPTQVGEIAGEQVGAIRLVPNDPALKFTGRVRETLIPALNVAKIQVEGVPFRIERGLRELDRDLKIRRAKRNIQLAELEMRERGPQPTLLNCLADAFLVLGQNERAAQFFRQAIGLSAKGSSDMLCGYYGLIMALEHSDQGRMAQLNTCVAALEIYPMDAQLLCAAGGYLQSLGQLDMAIRAYETAHRFGRVNPEVWHLNGIVEVAASCYAIGLQLLGRLDDARRVLEAELTTSPDSLRLRRQLLQLCIKQGDRKEALANVERLPPETPYREALKSAVRGACLAVEEKWIPARAYLEAAYRNGSRDTICLEWYVLSVLAAGEAEAAVPLLAEWRAADPQNPQLSRLIAAVSDSIAHGTPLQLGNRAIRFDAPKATGSATRSSAPSHAAATVAP
jgi:tetratricopeptide (TPR) repeat protein